MIKKLKSGGVIQRVAAVILCIAVLIYTVYHISSVFGEDIATISTGVSREAKVVDSMGYIFRNESVLFSQNNGAADYIRQDGDKVSVGDKLATVYESGSASAKSILRLLDSKIAILEQSVGAGYTLADLPEVNDGISEAYYALARSLSTKDTGSISEQTDKLLLNMNCHSLLTDGDSPVDDTLRTMKEQREAIITNSGKGVVETSEDSGYFYTYVDGYESYFTADAALELTVADYYRLISEEVSADKNVLSKAYGKLAESSEWYFAVKFSEISSEFFKAGESYELEFVENGNKVIPMTLISLADDTEHGGKLAVFFADRLPDGFVFGRSQSVSIEVSSVSGIYVPKSAVHRGGGTYYVYVLKGSVVFYRRIDVVYEGSDYYLCATEVKDDSGAKYLGTNELLIINGNNLFDGRILD
ncbi:MAG: hypothetical protein J6B72_02500 [Clostridia bacterium]|nr:hypothetical protein [Clostridia bacterium]